MLTVRHDRILMGIAAVILALVLVIVSTPAAAKPPVNKVYLAIFNGPGQPGGLLAECLKFYGDGTLCALDSDPLACGTWAKRLQAADSNKRYTIDYSLEFLEEGVRIMVDGTAWFDARNKGSSIGAAAQLTVTEPAAGLVAQAVSRSNHAMAANQMKVGLCRNLRDQLNVVFGED